MTRREPTAQEKAFFLQKDIEQLHRVQVVESVRDLIGRGHTDTSDFDAIDAQELIEEIFAGTRFVLRGDIDYRSEEECEDDR